jgi:hypothetical protein
MATMPNQIDTLVQKRDLILQQMQDIDHLRRGSLSKQFFKSPSHKSAATRGPYYVLQGFFHGKKFSERIPADQATQVQEQVQNYRRFQSLAEEYVTLSDQITRLEFPVAESKKNSNSKNSPRSSSRKPKLS